MPKKRPSRTALRRRARAERHDAPANDYSRELLRELERAKRRIVGRLHDERGVLVLIPEDRRIAHDILVPPGEARKGKPGEIVTIDLIEPPAKHVQPVGRVAEVLGHHADPGMEIEIALRKFDLPHRFSKQAMALARSIPDAVRDEA